MPDAIFQAQAWDGTDMLPTNQTYMKQKTLGVATPAIVDYNIKNYATYTPYSTQSSYTATNARFPNIRQH